MKAKENAWSDFRQMMIKSWTFNRLTDDEKIKAFDALHFANDDCNAITGNYRERWNAMNAVWFAFLLGVGYDNSCDWRNDRKVAQGR